MTKNSATPSAKADASSPNRHAHSDAKLERDSNAVRGASQAASTALSTSRNPVQPTIAKSSSLAAGQARRSSVSKTSFRAARMPPNRRSEEHTSELQSL